MYGLFANVGESRPVEFGGVVEFSEVFGHALKVGSPRQYGHDTDDVAMLLAVVGAVVTGSYGDSMAGHIALRTIFGAGCVEYFGDNDWRTCSGNVFRTLKSRIWRGDAEVNPVAFCIASTAACGFFKPFLEPKG